MTYFAEFGQRVRRWRQKQPSGRDNQVYLGLRPAAKLAGISPSMWLRIEEGDGARINAADLLIVAELIGAKRP